jgi:hypothetical protein
VSVTPRIERVREVRERLLATGAVVARFDGGRRELLPVAIGAQEGLALREWVRRERALSTLEIGLGFAIEDEGKEGTHEWAVLRTGTHGAFLRPFDQLADF